MSEIKIYNKDCLIEMRKMKDNAFDLAIVDPPYGIKKNMVGSRQMGLQIKNKTWNDDIPKKEYFEELFRVSVNQIIFGANYYSSYLPHTRGWLVWDKKMSENIGFSMNEIAFTSFDCVPKTFYCRADRLDRIHPCQKPVKLYEWILDNYAKNNHSILDTHLGSGSIALACINMNFNLTSYEIDKEYYHNAVDRIKKHRKQLKIF